MGELNVEYPCGHKINVRLGWLDFAMIKYEPKDGCPLHGKKCGASHAKN